VGGSHRKGGASGPQRSELAYKEKLRRTGALSQAAEGG